VLAVSTAAHPLPATPRSDTFQASKLLHLVTQPPIKSCLSGIMSSHVTLTPAPNNLYLLTYLLASPAAVRRENDDQRVRKLLVEKSRHKTSGSDEQLYSCV